MYRKSTALVSLVIAMGTGRAQTRSMDARDLFLKGSQAANSESARQPSAWRESAPGAPLALRYSVLKYVDPGFREVDPGVTFRSGDKVKFAIQPNDDGYLYLVHRGASGEWKMLFPAPGAPARDNYVRRGQKYDFPGSEREVFLVSAPAGVESVFVVLSRRPVDSLERFISPEPSRPPSAEPRRSSGPDVMVAQRKGVDERILSGLRQNVQSRGLVQTKIDERRSGPEGETAIYVADPTDGPDDWIVAEFALNHR